MPDSLNHSVYLLVADCNRESPGLPDGSEYEEVPQSGRNSDSRCVGFGILPEFGELFTLLPGLDYRGAAGGLYCDHSGKLAVYPAQFSQFSEGLPHPNYSCASPCGVEDDIRQLPSHLLRQFNPHGLLSFNPVRFLESRYGEPANFIRTLGDNSAALSDEAVNQVGVTALGLRLLRVDLRGVVRAQDRGPDACPTGIGSEGRTCIPIGWDS